MAQVKAVVPETVMRSGYAILNAEDDLVYAMREGLDCNIALFSMDEKNPRIKKHGNEGGLSAVYENGFITIMKGNWKVRVMSAKDIPITFGGKALHNIANVLPAALACYLFQDITIEDIRQALQTFIPSTSQTPGRLNFFQMKNSTFLVDFAHNPHGLKLLGDFVNNLDYPHKTGIITGTGDRRDEDIRELGELSAHYFDDIIIRLDKNLRGRPGEEIIDLLHSGVKSVDPNLPVTIIEDEDEAIHYAYTNAPPGTLVTLMCDGVSSTLEKIKQLKLKEEQGSEKGKVDDLSSINA